ncbi:UDP-N-acetylmuramate:L-alanyl-gamma-D-glutamyl-meso-diaminopimelate ligase [Halieaceae bacterium IMCC14734]|uniref:UDP-N-acetylmuramate--L-alanyl-gamma-D-glutamyl-meso-2,6-diaminoheptandioate ligase n=1 Tax=Candidatus Litorirhabdus singularis TaxID=2518993 RepID=A0ABT3TL90_9GAMM|nr:UDP-N-acetylmuramate:L-alanyl-gamma-D-glutamyl-meso-diaminopimelate ligase [Candidatus Litorirhabdus singularis]MCX2983097.1 UDP-N-acetylmuramate:L-alanyl-gamma-D-glutamyl-meso-diaminopimelate ligase [Candidatus Litorirhabdus singularis]
MSKHIHILGICGTFMGGIALLARELGYTVSGSDANVYPPMSTQLENAGITLMEGYEPAHLQPAPDVVVVGNALSRGNPAVEYVLNRGLPYTSGPQWLAENVLRQRWVLAVAGTHGKTSTSSLLAWLLEQADMSPGFLIGGVPANFGVSARLGESDFFVVEADEYDTAFFDKRSKFVHYHPRTVCLNNLEFDHADIFADLDAIKTQFHHLLRTVPGEGLVVYRGGDAALADVLELGCWSGQASFAVDQEADWRAQPIAADATEFSLHHGPEQVTARWSQTGQHSMENALAAVAAAHHVGVPLGVSVEGLASFTGVKRRMELLAEVSGIAVYDDFAHHPTAIATTLAGMRARVGDGRILVLLEPRSNTMRLGQHRAQLAASTEQADEVFWYQPPGLDWDLQTVVDGSAVTSHLCSDTQTMVDQVVAASRAGDQIVIMSNGGFDGVHQKLIAALRRAENIAHKE